MLCWFRRHRLIIPGAGITVAVGFGLLVWCGMFSRRDVGSSRINATNRNSDEEWLVSSRIGAGTDGSVGLLADYYEHGIEHTPPRDPSGAMQRREHQYRAPADPLDLIRSKLKSDADDGALRHKFDEWEK